ncbi:hypothetical protein AORI_5352 [Amycolatopsis keratiniphila]|uniref:Uncharacterized protein n=1 Tax=Amycolatopsis keratiniphila TaxID=129921 RepID=R4SZH7_9PSEU|nr:hypothetical protein AORI_5352 [Amycolatopsis keratiniphila]
MVHFSFIGCNSEHASEQPLADERADVSCWIRKPEFLPIGKVYIVPGDDELTEPEIAMGGCVRCRYIAQPTDRLDQLLILLHQLPQLEFPGMRVTERVHWQSFQLGRRGKPRPGRVQPRGTRRVVQLGDQSTQLAGGSFVESVVVRELAAIECGGHQFEHHKPGVSFPTEASGPRDWRPSGRLQSDQAMERGSTVR